MERIADFIVKNISIKLNEHIYESVMQCGMDMHMELDEMCNVLFSIIDRTKIVDFKLYPENLGRQRKIIISFKFQCRTCEIGEHYGSQRDYFWVTILPV
jgi:hypothetical protein